MVYRFIDDNNRYFGLRWLCRHLNISLNCYYNYLQDKKQAYREQSELILDRIKYIYYNNNRTVGYRAVRVFLHRYGIWLSNTTVHKYMNRELELGAVIMRKKPGYKKCKKHHVFDNLLNQNFSTTRKNHVWCTDFTYMRQPNGKFYCNCTILDLYDRSVVASLNSSFINTDLAVDTLKKALEQEHHPQGLIIHSDQGVQFTSIEFVDFCRRNGITQSMSQAGYPYDNAPMERFYNTFKNCFYYRYTFESIEMLNAMTKSYINWYNSVRPHSANGYRTPMEARYN